MANQINELAAAGAVAGADLLWLEQSGFPTKLSYTALVTALGSLPVGTVTNAALRWSGSAWVEETDIRIGTGGLLSTSNVVRAGGHVASTTLITADLTGTTGVSVKVGTAVGGWARGVAIAKESDGLRLGGYGYLGSNESLSSWHVGFGTDWWAGDSILTVSPTAATLVKPLTIDTDAAGAALVIGDGTSVSGDILVHFNMDRSWEFKSQGEDASNNLVLNSVTSGKNFIIQEADVTKHTFSSGGDYNTVGSITATDEMQSSYYSAAALGPNTSTGTDGLRVGGYGIMGDRSGTIYITNAHATGSITFGVAGVHNTQNIAVISGTGMTLVGDTAGTSALTVTNAGTANKIAEFIGDSDSLLIECIAAGDYRISNTQQTNGIVMYDGTGGVDILYNSVVALSCDSGNDVTLWYSGTEEAWTQDHNASGQTSGFATNDYGGTKRDVGFATMETITFTANTVVAADHWSQKCLEHTNATTHTLTFNTLSTVPNGAVMWVKATTGIVTLVDGSMVLSFYDGSSVTTGNVSVAVGGWATIHKTGNSAADVTGVGLT